MQLLLRRMWFTKKSTMGCLYVENIFEAYTLEPPVPVVPEGTYKLVPYPSPKNKRIVPLLVDVPGHEYVEIHVLNFPEETEGCIGVGQIRDEDAIHFSKKALDALMSKLQPVWDKKEEVTIKVQNG